MKTVIYLAGPISGPLLPENRRRFYDVEAKVLAHWFGRVEKVILNPATLPLGLTEQDYMYIGMSMLAAADTVVMLEGWEQSAGATIEFNMAKKCGKRVFSENKGLLFAPSPGSFDVPPHWRLARD